MIDARIKELGDWRGKTLAQGRPAILEARDQRGIRGRIDVPRLREQSSSFS